MTKKFTAKGYPELGKLTADDVVYYDVFSCGYNIPATPSPEGVTALHEIGKTWNLTGFDMFVPWDGVHDVRRLMAQAEETEAKGG